MPEPLAMQTDDLEHCIDECTNCHAICLETVQHCLKLGAEHAAPEHIELLFDCAQISQTSADFMLRGSPRHVLTCAACAEICRACAEECDRLGRNDEMMQLCAEECRRCAEACARMAG
jgi:hypothetical protein